MHKKNTREAQEKKTIIFEMRIASVYITTQHTKTKNKLTENIISIKKA
jgi:hypothetical protein